MKKIILLVLSTLCFYQCKTQKTTITQQNNIPVITKEFEVFDTATFNKYKTDSTSFYVSIKLDEKKYLEMAKGQNQHHSSEYNKDSYFFITKIFYPNNNIKFKGIYFNNGFPKGIWYYYNEDGSFSHEVNYDTPYKFNWDNILQYCKDHNIILDKGHINGGWHTTINRVSAEKIKASLNVKPMWTIEHYILNNENTPNTGNGNVETIYLDGITGKEIKRENKPLPKE